MASSANNQTFQEIKLAIKKRQLAPIYILSGEEGYFIDELVKDFEALVPEDERDFNLYALYAPEITPETVMATCKRFPMMSERQVVILKEAQAVRADLINKLHIYAENPNPSTVLVICFRGDKAKGKDLLDKAKANGGVMFESKRPTERNIDPMIASLVKDKGLTIEPKGIAMLRDFIGLDVAKLYNEINKMALVLGKGALITPESIERNVGVSKDFNNFELVDAIAAKDSAKVFRIINYFRSNPKKNPGVLTIAAIFSYFSNLMVCQFARDKSPNALMSELGIKWPKQLERYTKGMRNYNAYKSIEILTALREFDTKSKGIGSRQSEWDLMHDLMFRILTCTGKIEI
jgi:DNA polymerase-3 subunit delta